MWNVFILFYLCMYFVRNDEIKLWYVYISSDLAYVQWRLKSPTTRVFVHQLAQANLIGNIKTPLYSTFVTGIDRYPVTGGFPSQRQ